MGGGGRGEAGRCVGAGVVSVGRESCWVIVVSFSGTVKKNRKYVIYVKGFRCKEPKTLMENRRYRL